jgi:hypothetical protein
MTWQPGGGVARAELRNAMMQRRISRLRRLAPHPFGLKAKVLRPMPVMLGSEPAHVGAGSRLLALMTRSPVPLGSISLCYGRFFDLSAQLAEVTTYWDGGGWAGSTPPDGRPPSARELGRAEGRDAAIARKDWKAIDAAGEAEPDGPFSHATAEIVVSGEPRSVPKVSYRHYQAFSFAAGEVIVTVVSRYPFAGLPSFEPVADLEPCITGWMRHLRELAERAQDISNHPL